MKKLTVNDKIKFNYFDHDLEKEIFGRGRLVEIDLNNGRYMVQTTRKLHWMEYDSELKNIILI